MLYVRNIPRIRGIDKNINLFEGAKLKLLQRNISYSTLSLVQASRVVLRAVTYHKKGACARGVGN